MRDGWRVSFASVRPLLELAKSVGRADALRHWALKLSQRSDADRRADWNLRTAGIGSGLTGSLHSPLNPWVRNLVPLPRILRNSTTVSRRDLGDFARRYFRYSLSRFIVIFNVPS